MSVADAASDQPSKPAEGWGKFDEQLDRLSERLNPILVKEARQAMKSRQFSITFSLLLIFGWLYTAAFVVLSLPGIFYNAQGGAMLLGYFLLLAAPMLIVVPYGAFRSLAGELEDGTFELVSISTLSARQIVLGKLGSSVLQMLVYYSALAPCIAFTYLLRGVDVLFIALVLGWTFLASLLLSTFALALSTLTRARYWQVLLSAVLVMALLAFTIGWCVSWSNVLMFASQVPYDLEEFWTANFAAFTYCLAVGVLLVQIAAAQVTFASENRSTALRTAVLAIHVLLVGWPIYLFLRVDNRTEPEILLVGYGACAVFWSLAGACLIGEAANLSPRAQRQLPQSLLGRTLFTWFNPGSATGYLFTSAALLSAAAVYVPLLIIYPDNRGTTDHRFLWTTLLLWAYPTAYLGLVRLILTPVKRKNLLLSVLLTALLALLGVAGPFLCQYLYFVLSGEINYANFSYSPLQLTNWFWTVMEMAEGRLMSPELYALPVLVVAGGVLLLNLVLAHRETGRVRMLAPQRVQQDEMELHPEKAPGKRNPWDEPGDSPGNPKPAPPTGGSPFRVG